jgi:hypothetical protein
MIGSLEKRLIAAGLLLAWLGVILVRVVMQFGGALPVRPNLPDNSPVGARVHRAGQVESPYSLAVFASFKPARNLSNPFYPNPAQPAPPPTPPLTRSIDVLYQGYYMTSQGVKQAYITVGDRLVIGPTGAKVVANLVIADISLRTLTLQDGTGKKLVLDFMAKKPVEVPAQ